MSEHPLSGFIRRRQYPIALAFVLAALVVAAALALDGCYRLLPNAVAAPTAELQTATPSPTSRDVLEQTANYRQWPNFAENTTIERSAMHREMYVLAFHNDVVTRALESRTLPLPDGAVIVKENYAHKSDAQPKVLTIMAKESGRWYWLEATPEGRVVLEKDRPQEGFDLEGCRSCHSHAENDFVFTHQFK